MLGGLVGNVDAGQGAELPRPHAGAVHDDLGLNIAARGAHRANAAPLLQHPERGHAFQELYAAQACALAQRHRDIDRIHPAVFLDVEAGLHPIDAHERKQVLHLPGRELLHVHSTVSVEGGNPPILLQAVPIGRRFDETNGRESRSLPSLGLEPAVQVARVLAHFG